MKLTTAEIEALERLDALDDQTMSVKHGGGHGAPAAAPGAARHAHPDRDRQDAGRPAAHAVRGQRSMKWRSYLMGLLTAYLFVGLFAGTTMARAMPALNGLGAFYVAATWPAAMVCAATGALCGYMPPPGSPLANAFFTFSRND